MEIRTLKEKEKLILCLSCGVATLGEYCPHCNHKKIGGVDV